MAIAGIPWWTTDIGGFHGARGDDPVFRELFARWFAYGCFCPVMRLHGDREPRISREGEAVGSGSPNEIWSFGEEIYALARKYIEIRERLRPYLREQMRIAHEKGTPVMRPYFYDCPGDERAWEVDDAYFLGPDLLIAPVMEQGATMRRVYLPEDSRWKNFWTEELLDGGQEVEVPAPLDQIPVFVREESGWELSGRK